MTAVLAGAGQRGRHVYGAWALDHPDDLRFVAVAEPDPVRREAFGNSHRIPGSRRFSSWEGLLDGPQIADAAVIATPDRLHHAPALAALSAGYRVLLEKPMAPTLDQTIDLVRRARDTGDGLHVAHVLRYTPFFRALHRIIDSGRLGDVVSVRHQENLVAWHMAHSFVRGNWAQEKVSSPMIVQKCCHDFDILQWNLPARVTRLASDGGLFEFRPERRPPDATDRCIDGCPVAGCPYDARRIYLRPEVTGWPVHVITEDLSTEARLDALTTGPYGRCVYTAESDVVDHQVVTMVLEDGATVTLTMQGHSHEEGRTMRYDGTRATLRGIFGARQEITVHDHATGGVESIPISDVGGGHGGGDEGLIAEFVQAVRSGSSSPTGAGASLESHLLAFLAEEARRSGRWVDVTERRVDPA